MSRDVQQHPLIFIQKIENRQVAVVAKDPRQALEEMPKSSYCPETSLKSIQTSPTRRPTQLKTTRGGCTGIQMLEGIGCHLFPALRPDSQEGDRRAVVSSPQTASPGRRTRPSNLPPGTSSHCWWWFGSWTSHSPFGKPPFLSLDWSFHYRLAVLGF